VSLLGIDVGTSACKAVAFDLAGLALATATREYPLQTPAPGRLELDANTVWDAVKATVREVNASLADPVSALAVSSQGEAVTPVGMDGTVLAGSPVTFDTRAVEQSAQLEAAVGRERLAQTTGQPPHPMFTIAKLKWWAEHELELVCNTWKFLCFGDLISWRLGGEAAIDFSMAARTMAFDIHAFRWSGDVLAAAGIPPEKLATPVPAGTPIGTVAATLARELGFAGSPTIVAGGHDQPCGARGAGATSPGEAMLAIGTTICLAPVFAQPEERLLAFDYPCYPHVVPGRWITLAGNFTGGSLLRWFRDTLGELDPVCVSARGQDAYDLLTQQADDQPSPLLVLPHFAGSGAPSNDPQSRGAIVGLGFSTTRGQIIRALLEGVMFEMALNRETLARADVDVAQAVAVGGGARSDHWLEIAADILGMPIRRSSQTEAACWGAARLAGEGTGLLHVDDETSDHSEARIFFPDPERSGYYRDRLAVYRRLYGALRPLHAAL
jgi:xylulokinase